VWVDVPSQPSTTHVVAALAAAVAEARARGCDPMTDLQVLSPMRRGPLGTDALNAHLRPLLNPLSQLPALGLAGALGAAAPATVWEGLAALAPLGLGDRVLQTTNDYTRGVVNGDLGVLQSARFPDGTTVEAVGVARAVLSLPDGQRCCIDLAPCLAGGGPSVTPLAPGAPSPLPSPPPPPSRARPSASPPTAASALRTFRREGRVTVHFRQSALGDDAHAVEYSPLEARRCMLPGFALTVHKAQGAEWPAVVVALHSSHFVMLSRGLLYSALARAQRCLVVLGTRQAAALAVTRARSLDRWSLLADRLRWELAQPAAIVAAASLAPTAPAPPATTDAERAEGAAPRAPPARGRAGRRSAAALDSVWSSVGVGVGVGVGVHMGVTSELAAVPPSPRSPPSTPQSLVEWWTLMELEAALEAATRRTGGGALRA
jgi:hypothetical protein